MSRSTQWSTARNIEQLEGFDQYAGISGGLGPSAGVDFFTGANEDAPGGRVYGLDFAGRATSGVVPFDYHQGGMVTEGWTFFKMKLPSLGDILGHFNFHIREKLSGDWHARMIANWLKCGF
jgi:hypothetical protein